MWTVGCLVTLASAVADGMADAPLTGLYGKHAYDAPEGGAGRRGATDEGQGWRRAGDLSAILVARSVKAR